MSVKNALEAFGQRVQQQAKSNLTKKGKKDSGGLYDSIKYDLQVHKNSFHLSIKMEQYGAFVDQGVKGKSSSMRAPNSPFRFGTGTGKKGGLTNAMEGWAQRKRIQFSDRKTGRFLSYKSTAFLMARAIYQKGIAPTNFISGPFRNEFAKLPEEVTRAYGLEVENFLRQTLRQ